MTWAILVLALLAVVGVLLSWSAGRLDRLHTRVEGARAALDAQLFHRCGAALEVATSGALDPATSLVLIEETHEARAAEGFERERTESDLTRALVNAFDAPEFVDTLRADADVRPVVDELADACRRVEMARRLYNDTVSSALTLRSQPLVRWARLAGRAPAPAMVEMIDETPRAFRR
jgi:hypothetical protein